ncbi:alpha/beta fold hydrolase [Nguyenibacter vanlangensis]|uniref:Alpha/beta fold hydrolase n=1 Tax=Nguyenibacter vanlangensis TaxID=1216886 RepID=A0ABZ3D709_9PROT
MTTPVPAPSERPGLLLVHGWGFTPDFWNPVLDRLDHPDPVTLDFGFFGPDSLAARPTRPFVAVGHSLGTLWLLLHRSQARIGPRAAPGAGPCVGIVLLNGFARFGAAPDYPAGVAPRIIDRMAHGLDSNPDDVVATFRARAGITTPAPAPARADRLAHALRLLRDADARTTLPPDGMATLRILAGRQDPIVPPDMTTASFPAPLPVDWVEDGGHLLPLTHPARCAALIADLLAAIPPARGADPAKDHP